MPKTNKIAAGGRTALPLLLWLPLMAALLLSGCAAQSSSQQEPRQTTQEQTRESETAASGVEEASRRGLGSPALGDAGAPVVMVEYADFQ